MLLLAETLRQWLIYKPSQAPHNTRKFYLRYMRRLNNYVLRETKSARLTEGQLWEFAVSKICRAFLGEVAGEGWSVSISPFMFSFQAVEFSVVSQFEFRLHLIRNAALPTISC